MLIILATGFYPASAAPTTPDAFIAAVKSAIDAKSADQILLLTCTAGMSDIDKQQTLSIDRMVLFANAVASVSLGPLPDDFQSIYIANGKKIEPTAAPKGLVVVQFTKAPGNGAMSTSLGYGIIDGSYYLLASRTTDLGWKGPPDKTLSFMVMGPGQNGLALTQSGTQAARSSRAPSRSPPSVSWANILTPSLSPAPTTLRT